MACPWWTELESWQLLLGRLGHLQRELLERRPEHLEPLGQQERLQPEHRERLAQWGHLGHQGPMERREPMEPLVHRERPELKERLQPEHRGRLGQKGHRELQEPMEPLVRLGQQERLALLEHRRMLREQMRPERKEQ